VKKLISIFLLILFLAGNILLLTSPSVKSAVKASPGLLHVYIEEYPEKEIHYKIKVSNPFNYDIEVSARSSHPYHINETYAKIPNLSWIKIVPESMEIPAKSSKEFEIIIDIPENERPLHYNKSWESRVIITPKNTQEATIVIQVQLAVKIFIHTPTGQMNEQTPLSLYIFIGIIGGFVILITVSFIFKKKRTVNMDRTAIFYYKKKEKDNHKKN